MRIRYTELCDYPLNAYSSKYSFYLFTVSSYLLIARAVDPPIVRYDPEAQSYNSWNYDGSAQSISVDEYNNVVYWANFDSDMHRVMKTTYNGKTTDLNITYSGKIAVANDVFHFYVLDEDNHRIDEYSKTTLEKQGNITSSPQILDLTIGYGES